MTENNQLGFKNISIENWSEKDPIWDAIYHPAPDPLLGWMADFLAVELKPEVPLDIRRLFEVARGTFVYGLMFYPLMTIGAEQISRVSEAAVSWMCFLLNSPQQHSNFANKIKWLVNESIISSNDSSRWQNLRHLRNESSHPKFPNILPPAMCLQTMEEVAELINNLFSVPPDQI